MFSWGQAGDGGKEVRLCHSDERTSLTGPDGDL
jgi:hypothetical protein